MTTTAGPALLGEALEDLASCVHCGFCLPVCPTYLVLGDENDSPRGRLVLMRAAGNGEISVDGPFGTHIDRCLGCRACETVCPAGVPYGQLLERARGDMAAPTRPAPRLALNAITSGYVARVIYAAGRLLRSITPLTAGARRIPGPIGRLVGLLEATRPSRSMPGRTAAIIEPPTPPIWQYVLLEGCVMSGLFAHVQRATRRVLAAAGASEVKVEGQTCCGALHAHAGQIDAAIALARRNIEAFEKAPDARIVTDSAGCGAALRDYPEWFADDPAWKERATAVALRAQDVSESIAQLAEHLPPMQLTGHVAYDAPCHLRHAQGVAEAPLSALRQIQGLEVRNLPSSDRCCGGAGIYNLREPDLAARVIDPKLDEIGSSGCDWVATGNPGCVMYIGSRLRQRGLDVPVVHPIELLDAALAGNPAGILGGPETGR